LQQVINKFLALGRKHERHQARVVVQTTTADLGLSFQSREIEEIVVVEFLFSSFDDQSLEELSQNVLVVKRQKRAFVF
jgi:hypothetical protein